MDQEIRHVCIEALLNHTSDNIYFKDTASRFLLVNRSMAEWCGLPGPEAFTGKTDADLFAAKHAAEALADEQALISGQVDIVRKEEQETWPDGRVTWVSTVKRPLVDGSGRILGTFGISRDITARRNAEDALLSTTRRLQDLVEIVNRSPAVVFQWGADPNWPVQYVSDNVRQFGYDPESLRAGAVNYASLVHPEDIEAVRDGLDRAIAEEAEHYTLDYRLICKNGQIRHVEELGIIRRNPDGRITSYQGLVVDVTARHMAEAELAEYRTRLEQMVGDRTRDLQIINHRLEEENSRRRASEEALKESEQRYRHLLGTVTDYVYTVELRDGRPVATHHGPGCLAVTGFAPEEYERNPFLWFEMVVSEDRAEVLRQSAQVLETGQAPAVEHRLKRKDGTLRWVRSSVAARSDEAGRLAGYDGLVKDITEQHEAREARLHAERETMEARQHETLERADRLSSLGILAAGVAHEVNNPLQGMLSHLDAVRRALPPDFARLRNLDMVERGIESIASLVQRLLWIGSAPEEAADAGCVFADAIGFVTDLLLAQFQKRNVRIAVQARALHARIAIPRRELVQVLMNLLMNARDAMPEGGTVTIECDCKGAETLIAIRDTGTGIPKDILPRIFSPFFTTKGAKGTGLGLSVAESLVRNRQGRIDVQSEPGAGSVFTICLPSLPEPRK
jgi:PAS domain S-box-containing protein